VQLLDDLLALGGGHVSEAADLDVDVAEDGAVSGFVVIAWVAAALLVLAAALTFLLPRPRALAGTSRATPPDQVTQRPFGATRWAMFAVAQCPGTVDRLVAHAFIPSMTR
jgi:hypothetical protein